MNERNELAAALAKAQGAFKPVAKSGKNPHLKNDYATLDDVITATREALTANGLAVAQPLETYDGETVLHTILMHSSGQSIQASVKIPALADNRGVNALQALGAAISYMRRYALSSMLGVTADTDTDGEGATQPAAKAQQARPAVKAQPPKAQPKQQAAPVETGEAPEPPGVDPETGEIAEPAPEGGYPTNPKELYAAVNAVIPFYNSVGHMRNTLRKIADQNFEWPGEPGAYPYLYGELIGYARDNAKMPPAP